MEQPASLSRLSILGSVLRLSELQHEIVGLADRDVLRAVLVAHGQSRWQSPHALRVVLCVLGIGINLRGRDEFEACLFYERDCIVLTNVTALRLRVLRLVVAPAMVLDAQDAARLQCAKARS